MKQAAIGRFLEWAIDADEWTARAGDMTARCWRIDTGDWLWAVEIQSADLAWQICAGYDTGHSQPESAALACEDGLIRWLASHAKLLGQLVEDWRRVITEVRQRDAEAVSIYERVKGTVSWEVNEAAEGLKPVALARYKGFTLEVQRGLEGYDYWLSEPNYCHGGGRAPSLEAAQMKAVVSAYRKAERTKGAA